MTRASVLALALAAIGWAGCTALTAVDPTPIYCEQASGEPDPCPTGTQCIDNVCMAGRACQTTDACNGVDDDCDSTIDEGAIATPACASGACVAGVCRTECVPEVCDGLDNDCDGTEDNGLSIDADGDGYLACEPTMPSREDCDDGNDQIYPMAREQCNGFDDDCNGGTAESAPGVCAGDETCRTVDGERAPRCLNLGDCLSLITCIAPQVCDEERARCCNPGAADCMPIGDCRTSGCAGTDRCMEDDSGIFSCGAPRGPGVACRADTDCASDRCYPYGSLALTAPSGTAVGVCGTPCCDMAGCSAQSGTVCWAPGTGARACIPPSLLGGAAPSYELCDAFSDCGADYCAARSVPTPDGTGAAYTCGRAPGSAEIACWADGDCQTGFCYTNFCRYPCATDRTCEETLGCFGGSPSCVFLPSGRGRLAACACRRGEENGRPCGSNADCRDNYCVPGANVCASSCCTDATCAAGQRCSPVPVGGSWGMHCLDADGPG